MYLIDTNVISEARKGRRANVGVQAFFREASEQGSALYLSVITIGELRRGVDLIRHRGGHIQSRLLDDWLTLIVEQYRDRILPIDTEAALLWGRLRVPHHEHAIDKLIAATAWVNGLTLVTRNISASDFRGGRCRLSSRMARCSASALRPLAAARCFRACTRDSSNPRTSRLVMVISRQESPEQVPYCIPARKNGRTTCSEDRQVIAMLSP